MSRVRAANHGHRRVLAAVALLASLVLAILGLAVSGASAGPPPTTSTTTTPTTVEPTTTTTVFVTTTQRVTTTTGRPASTTTTAPATSTTAEPTTTLEETTTTSAEPTTTSTVAITTPTTVESTQASSSSPGLSTDTKLAIIVGGLLAVAVAIAVLTILYWRHTRPVAVVDEVDDEPGVDEPVAPVVASSGFGSAAAASSTADSAGGPPTEELPLFTNAAPATGVATPSDSEGDVAAIGHTLFGPDPVATSPSSTAVTLEDLFGPSDETKGPAAR